jgi:hypothetical protein
LRHYYRNKEKYRQYSRLWAAKNPDKVRLRGQRYRDRHRSELNRRARENVKKNRVTVLARRRELAKRRSFRDRVNAHSRLTMKLRPELRLRHNLRNSLWQVLKRVRGHKSVSVLQLVGCDLSFLRGYLESRFEPGMSWENYGEWHVDHIIPCAAFDFTNPVDAAHCYHYSNLQPMWARDNRRKRARVARVIQKELI